MTTSSDGYELNTSVSDPNDTDSDDDGLGDACGGEHISQ